MLHPSQAQEVVENQSQRTSINDQEVAELIDDPQPTELWQNDVSDVNLYGKWFRRQLEGPLAEKARQAGLEPKVFQAIQWWCFAFYPVVYRGTYLVIPYSEVEDEPDVRYRLCRVADDRRQIAYQRMISCGVLLLAALMFTSFLTRSWLMQK